MPASRLPRNCEDVLWMNDPAAHRMRIIDFAEPTALQRFMRPSESPRLCEFGPESNSLRF
jgi:hypothetical protein